MPKLNCSLCKRPVDSRRLVSPQKMENQILEIIKRERPEWEATRGICRECLEQYRAKKFLNYLEAEYQKMSEIEQSLVTKIARRGRVTKLVNTEFEAHMTFGQHLADKVAHFGGSWPRSRRARRATPGLGLLPEHRRPSRTGRRTPRE